MAVQIQVGTIISERYRIIGALGQGGMGVTYRAWDIASKRPVVLKHPRLEMLEKPGFIQRFNREARMMAALSHDNVVPITTIGEHDGVPYLTMPFLPGGSLLHHRARDNDGRPKPMHPSTLHLWLPQIADALDYIHSSGIVHRDVKPANIFFNGLWHAYLGDFGIAKIVGETSALEKEQTLTATSMMVGTDQYMAPEMFSPKATVTGRADQYALAVIVYEILAGRRPFTGDKAHLIVEVATQPVPPLPGNLRDLPATLEDAVYRGLAKKPESRFASCRDFVRAALANVPVMEDEPGMARFACPSCGNVLKVKAAVAGRLGRCPRCQQQMTVADDLSALWLLSEEAAKTGFDESKPPMLFTPTDSEQAPVIQLHTPSPGFAVSQHGGSFRSLWSQLAPGKRRLVIGATAALAMMAAAGLRSAISGRSTVLLERHEAVLRENGSFREELERLKGDPSPQPLVRRPRNARPSMTESELQAKLKAANPQYDGSGRIVFINNKIVEVHLGNKKIADISALKGLTLGRVGIERTQVTDITPLAGMPVSFLNCDDLGGLVDISALKGMPLIELGLARTGVTDLTALRGLPLARLNLEGTRVSDLEPLKAMPLEWLNLNDVKTYTTFQPLAGMAIRELFARGTAVEDIRPLANKTLVTLDLSRAEKVKDLRPLRGLPLRKLFIPETKISDIGVVRELPTLRDLDARGSELKSLKGIERSRMRYLNLAQTSIADLTPLKGLPLEHLDLTEAAKVTDLEPLAGMPLTELRLRGTNVFSVKPLKGMPLSVLELPQAAVVVEAEATPGMTEPELQAKLRAVNPEYDGSGRIVVVRGRIVEVHLGNKKIRDIGPLKGLSLGVVGLERTQVTDITPLAGMPLRTLNCDDLVGVVDISALKGAPLTQIFLARTGVTNVEPLRGMPLRRLSLEATRVQDLGPLKGMSLEWLNVNFVNSYTSFDPLKGMPLVELHAHGTSANNLEALAGMPLEILSINMANWIHDISSLRGMPLRNLHMYGTTVSDVTPLAGVPIRFLDAGWTRIMSLEGLEHTRLRWLSLEETAVSDLAPLKGLPIDFLNLNRATRITDLRPLSGMPLQQLHLYGTRVKSIDPLKGMPLQRLNLEAVPLSDARAVESLPLHYLNVKRTPFLEWGTDRW